MQSPAQLNRSKLKAAILRIVSGCAPEELGAVKLHKALYYADMVEFASTGHSITGAEYRKRPFGPTCDAALRAIRELRDEGAIEVREVAYFGYLKKEFVLCEQPSFATLSSDECALLDDVTAFVCREHTARAISEVSHDVSWQMTDMGQVIPYHLAFNLVPSIVSDESLAWADAMADEIERARPDQNPLDFEEFAAFRSRVLEARG